MKDKNRVYFAGSIRGGRDKATDYKKIVDHLKQYSIVLDEHVADPTLTSKGENIDVCQVYQRDVKWIQECDMLFAEVTNPSLGVGYELAYAESMNKKIICMYEESINLSAMIGGNSNFILIPYSTMDELLNKISNIFEKEIK